VGLQKIADGLSNPRAEKRLGKLQERIGRLKANSKGIGQHYDVELMPDESGKKAAGLSWTKRVRPNVIKLRTNSLNMI